MSDQTLIEQELFETWARNAVPQFSAAGKHVRDGHWSYNHNIVELMWQCWRAAKGSAALPSEAMIEAAVESAVLLRQREEDGTDYTRGFNNGVSAALVVAKQAILDLAMRATTPTAPDQDTGASATADQALAVPVEPVARLDPSGFDPSRQLLAKVLAYYEGREPYDFHRLSADQRENDAHDTWQGIAAEIRSHLGVS